MSIRLSDSFVSGYSSRSPNWGPIGEIIYLRTYSRWIDSLRRREYWHETVRRAVDYSSTLGPIEDGENERLFDAIWNLRAFPAGRTLWIGDTEISYSHPEANMNCSFEDFDDHKALHDMVLLLMSGSGVGYRVTQDVIKRLNEQLPLPDSPPEVVFEDNGFIGYDSSSYTETTLIEYGDSDAVRIVVGDSREGWADAVMKFIHLISWYGDNVPKVIINLRSVRPVGERLKRFGGYASGPQPLREFFEYSMLALFDKNKPKGWTDVKALDIGNLIARMVVSGGTRRSALIALGDSKEFANAKVGTWGFDDDVKRWVKEGAIPEGVIPPWRSQSNNSMLLFDRPDDDEVEAMLHNVLDYGEPGILNGGAAQNRRPNFRGGNPCLEILLDNHGFCNLSTVNLSSFVRDDGVFAFSKAAEALRLITRHTMRVTNVNLGPRLKEWDKIQKRDRLIGISLTGIMDAVNKTGRTFDDWVRQGILDGLKRIVDNEAKRYAEEMGIPEPLLKTTIKPEGTLSLLPGVSSGIHDAYAPYYIRRVRISKSDAVAEALIESGFEYEEDLFAPNTYVFSFPVSTPARRSSLDVPAVEALERYKHTMSHWTEHNTSITVSLSEEEVGGVVDWVRRNWDSIVGVSFLRKSTEVYPQQPYAEISKEQYEKMLAKTPTFDRNILDKIEGGLNLFMAVDDIESDCDSGHCPVR